MKQRQSPRTKADLHPLCNSNGLTTMPEDMPPSALDDFFAGLRDAFDDPAVLDSSGSYWRQRGYATGVVERIDRQFGYPRVSAANLSN